MRGRLPSLAILALALAFAAPEAFAANISVEHLELLSNGHVDEAGLFAVDSRLAFGLAIEGGEKFAGLLRIDFLSTQIERDLAALQGLIASPVVPADPDQDEMDAIIGRLNIPGLRLRTAAVSAKSLFGAPVEASYFVGSLDTFCSGDDFVSLFGASPFATELRGPLRFPDGIKDNPSVSWDGLHAVYGTGFRFGYTGFENSRLYAYLYQDSDIGPGKWSTDLRGLFDRGEIKLELFGGASFDGSHLLGLYRGGLLFFAAPGEIGEFYAQVGIPRWDPSTAFSAENIFFLFEPRVNFEGGSLILSVFYHPQYYRQQLTGEAGYLDVGFNLRFGRLAETGSQAGFETFLSLHPDDTAAPVGVDFSPYYDVVAAGVAWSFKLGVRPFPFPEPWYGIFRPFVGVKTSF